MLSFAARLAAAVRRVGNPVLVGIDPRVESLPPALLPRRGFADPAETAAAFLRFGKGVVDVVAPLVAAIKPQAAFYEQLGPSGMSVLAETILYARKKGLLVIFDGKRNDIGATAAAYARAYASLVSTLPEIGLRRIRLMRTKRPGSREADILRLNPAVWTLLGPGGLPQINAHVLLTYYQREIEASRRRRP